MNYGLQRKKKFILWCVMAVAAIALALSMVMVAKALESNEGYRTINVLETGGTVSVVKDGIEYKAYPGMLLQEGHELVVAGNSYARLVLDDDKYIKVESGSRVVFETLGLLGSGKTGIRLERGALTAEVVNPLSEGEEFVVNTPNAVLAVRGTFFRVDLTMDKKGEVLANVMTYGGKVATKRVFPSGETEEEETLVEAGYKTAINMDATDTVYVVQKVADVENDMPSVDETVVPIHKEEISDDDLVDIYFAAENGHELFVTADEVREDIESREINLEEKVSVYQLAEEALKQENAEIIGGTSEVVVLDQVAFADDSKPLEMASVEEEKKEDLVPQTAPSAEDTVQQMATLVDGPPTEVVSVHTHTEVTSRSEASCTMDGAIIVTCSSCGEVLSNVSIPKLGHTMLTQETEPTCTEAGVIVSTCSVCGYAEQMAGKAALGHTEVTESKSATCTSSGYSKTSCSVCGEILAESTTSGGHSARVTRTEPTCETEGLERSVCSTCGEVIAETVLSATGHDYSEEVTQEPTCTAVGERTYTCDCGHTYTEEIPLADHDYAEVINDPTDASNGSKYDSCRNCGATANTEMILAISAINFPDAAFCAFVESSYNKDGRAGLTKAEIAEVTSMTVGADVAAANLAGINYFSALETLTVQSTSLQELDVSMNPTLSTLNVMDATGLRMLNCSNTEIELLATTNLPALESILATNCTELDTITAGGCEALVSLDASGCTLLSYVDLAGDLQLTDLNLTGDTALTLLDVNSCIALTSLDVNFADKLEYLTVTYCWEMTSLNISNTDVAELDLTEVSKLQELNVSRTKLSSLNVDSFNSLTRIDAVNCESMSTISAQDCSNLSYVDASGSALNGAWFTDSANLVTLNLSNSRALSQVNIQNCTRLSVLDVTDCGSAFGNCIINAKGSNITTQEMITGFTDGVTTLRTDQ